MLYRYYKWVTYLHFKKVTTHPIVEKWSRMGAHCPWNMSHKIQVSDVKSVNITPLIYNLFLRLFTLPKSRTYKPNSHESDACRGNNSLWIRTLDRYTRAGLPECVVSTMSGPLPQTTQDRTQRTHTQSQDRH